MNPIALIKAALDIVRTESKKIKDAKEHGATEERERVCKILRDAGMYGGEIYESIRNRERK